jgi:hypothetical protein
MSEHFRQTFDYIKYWKQSLSLWLSVGSNPISNLSTLTPRKTTHKSPKLGQLETVGAIHIESSTSQPVRNMAALMPIGLHAT